jgi:hypothetical protein
MRYFPAVYSLLACLLLTACATKIQVNTDYDPEFDFSVYRTYAWHDRVRAPDGLVEDRIRDAIDATLVAKGYARVKSTGEPDFRVSFSAVAEQALRVDTVSTGLGYRHRNWGMGVSSTSRVREYTRGTLIIDIIDPVGKDLLWRGISVRTLAEGRAPEEKTRDVMEIVTAILQQFPPKPQE